MTNPAARGDPQGPIYGMPILDVDKTQTVLIMQKHQKPQSGFPERL